MKGNTRRRGKIASKETKIKLSLAKMGNKNRLGTLQTEETKNKISEAISGEGNGNAKINLSIAENIRKDYKMIKSQRKLAKKYNVTKSTIGRVLRNEIWIK